MSKAPIAEQQALPAVAVHSLAQASAALGAAGPVGVTLLSAPGAAASLGAPWFLALVQAAATSHPGVPHRAMLDCAEAPGHALAAMRAGLRWLVLAPECPGFAQLAAVAAACGATLLPLRPPALDLARVDLRRPGGQRLLAEWLRSKPDDISRANG